MSARNRGSLIITLYVSLAATGFGQQPLTLEEAVRQTESNHLYQMELMKVAALQEELSHAGKRLNPVLESEVGTGLIEGSRDHGFSLALTQRWERGGKRELRQEIAELEFEQARLEVEEFRRELISEVSLTYMELLSAENQLAIIRNRAERVDSLIQLDQVRLDQGEIPSRNLQMLQVETTRLAEEMDRLSHGRTLSQYHLNTLIGSPLETEYVLQDVVTERGPLPDVGRLVDSALENRPDLESLHVGLRLAEKNIAYAAARSRNDWDLGLGYRRNYSRTAEEAFLPRGVVESMTSSSNLLEFTVKIPLPIWNDGSNHVAAAITGREAIEHELAHAEAMARQEVMRAYQQVLFNQRKRQLYRESLLPRLEANLESIQTAYVLMGDNLLDWLQSHRDMSEALIQSLEIDLGVLRSIIQLEKAIGGSLGSVNQ